MALWCLGFAAVNLVFQITGHFVGGAYAHYASGVSSAVVTVQVRPAYATLGGLCLRQRGRRATQSLDSMRKY